jgi:hypothetical protein
MITKALLLGYTIEKTVINMYRLRGPDGREVMEYIQHGPELRGPAHLRFPAPWLAAKKALELAGVIDAKKPR